MIPVHGKNVFINTGIRAVGSHDRSSQTKIRRPCDVDPGLVVLQPGSVNGALVGGIHDDLRVELTASRWGDLFGACQVLPLSLLMTRIIAGLGQLWPGGHR